MGSFAQQNEPGRETALEGALELKASHLGISLDALLRVWLDERLKTPTPTPTPTQGR